MDRKVELTNRKMATKAVMSDRRPAVLPDSRALPAEVRGGTNSTTAPISNGTADSGLNGKPMAPTTRAMIAMTV